MEVEITRVVRTVGGWRAEGVARDADGVDALDRLIAYTLPDEGRAYLSVAWRDGTVATLPDGVRAKARRVARAAIERRAS